ncbi:unnamed protein product [Nesidiocoris tenuis]|uniref:ACN9 homolog (S. cerevisiae) n=2 Tax=Nesidiocoris tenuis TaxID=355587 RepID=A0ABN7BG01_9HEMI|nr:ACN9 homolog (S. cerevisiae) [Nesidiocoris tenuis]CAB0008529.1 unnamed protein product [Nesidiocoris tenuis]
MIGDPHVSRVRFLYKTILRLHRGLPEDLRLLGTSYLKDEFKRHKNVDVVAASRFIAGWTDYAINLTKQLDVKANAKLGSNLDPESLDNFNDEQVAQLYELKKVTKAVPES